MIMDTLPRSAETSKTRWRTSYKVASSVNTRIDVSLLVIRELPIPIKTRIKINGKKEEEDVPLKRNLRWNQMTKTSLSLMES